MPLTTFCSQIMTKKHNFSRELISTACQWYDFITSDLEQGNGKKKEEKKKLKKCGTLNYLFNIQLENVVWKYKTLQSLTLHIMWGLALNYFLLGLCWFCSLRGYILSSNMKLGSLKERE